MIFSKLLMKFYNLYPPLPPAPVEVHGNLRSVGINNKFCVLKNLCIFFQDFLSKILEIAVDCILEAR